MLIKPRVDTSLSSIRSSLALFSPFHCNVILRIKVFSLLHSLFPFVVLAHRRSSQSRLSFSSLSHSSLSSRSSLRLRRMFPPPVLQTFFKYYRSEHKLPVTTTLIVANILINLHPSFFYSLNPPIQQVWFNPHLTLKVILSIHLLIIVNVSF